MSRRGLLPLILVTCVGVGGGMYTFGPLMKENSYEARQQAAIKETTEAASASKATEEEVKRIAAAEAAASRNASTESVLSVQVPPSSWWPKMGLWSGGEDTKDNSPSKTPTTSTTDPEKKN